MKIIVILPAYNEAENIKPLIRQIKDIKNQEEKMFEGSKVIVVDDGSSDNTSEIAKKEGKNLDLIIKKHDRNSGLGPAIRTGLKTALEVGNKEDVIVILDADQSQPPRLIPRMVEEITKGFDVVIASRYVPGAVVMGIPYLRKLLSRYASLFMRIMYAIPGVKDYTTSFRMIRVDLLQKLAQSTNNRFYKEDNFVCACEFLFNLWATGAKFTEIPLYLRYDLKKGQSKMNLPKTMAGYLRLLVTLKKKRLTIS